MLRRVQRVSKIRNAPHVYTPPLKRPHIKWYQGNAEGFYAPTPTQCERDRIRASVPLAK